jgi:outer membrane protein OmpA-like peptidoglycan-associated protein
VYPIVVGNDGPGRNSAEDVVGIAGCGITALDSSLESGPSLADFMEKVLFDKLEPLPPSVPMMQKKEQGLSHEKLLKERNLTVELKAEFDFDRSSIRQEYLDDLQKIAEFMKKYPETVTTIEGHTCSIGTEKYNIALSAKRANSVKKQLTDLGIDPKRLNTAAYGETRPIADNSTPEGRQKNRRAVAVITTTIQEYVNQQK